MNPPLSTSLALLDATLQPYAIALSAIRSCNGIVVFMRDKHYTMRPFVLPLSLPTLPTSDWSLSNQLSKGTVLTLPVQLLVKHLNQRSQSYSLAG